MIQKSTNTQTYLEISQFTENSFKRLLSVLIILEDPVSKFSTVSTANADVASASISHDTVCAYISSQSNGSQIKYEDITQIDEDDIKEMDIKWNMALLSMRADKFWKKTGKKITIQGANVAGFDKSKVECFNCHKMGHFVRECRAPRSQDRGRRESYKQADEEAPTKFALMAKSSSSFENEVEARLVEFKTQEIKFCKKIRSLEFDVESKNNKIEYLMTELEKVKKEKKGLDSKLTGFEYASKDLDTLLGSQRTNTNKEGLGYSVVPPSCSTDSPTVIKTNKVETARKPSVKYAKMYRNTSKSPKVRAGLRNKGKAVKASACRIWRPKQNTSEKGPNYNGVSLTFNKYYYIDTQARSHTAKTFDLVWIWLGGDYRNLFSNGLHWDSVVNMCINFPHGSDSDQRNHEFIHVYLVSASVYVWIGLAFCDYHNMIAILEKSEHNVYFHQIVDFVEASHIRENIIKTSALPHESTPRVTSLDADEGSMQQKLQQLMDLYTGLQRQQIHMASKIEAQDLEISSLKARIKLLEETDKESAELSRDNAPIKWRSMEIGEEAGVEKITERGSNDTEELVNVLTPIDVANILTSGVQVVSVPPIAEVSTVGVLTVSGLVPTVSAIFTTASVVTPYSRHPIEILAKDKCKEKMVESDTLKKEKIQEHIDVQVDGEMEEVMAREDQRMNEQIARDAEIAKNHAEKELHMMIDALDRSNEVIAKHLHEYEQSATNLTIGEKIELINELVKYQDHHAKILKYQAQQSKPLSKKEQREFYMLILRHHAGWKTKQFRGMTLEEIREKFILVWKQFEEFVHMASKEEEERVKRKGLKLEQGSAIKMKTSEDVYKEYIKGMMQLVPVEEVYVEALQQLWAFMKETQSIRHASRDKEMELWVEIKRLFEPNFEDQLWTHTQNPMHDPLEWRLYDTCGVHHVFTKDQEIFMLVKRDYPLRRGLAIVMISNKF
nr:hypothetical protein [Tanacetum cinerariifolium]